MKRVNIDKEEINRAERYIELADFVKGTMANKHEDINKLEVLSWRALIIYKQITKINCV